MWICEEYEFCYTKLIFSFFLHISYIGFSSKYGPLMEAKSRVTIVSCFR
jgi:hypothetical protein